MVLLLDRFDKRSHCLGRRDYFRDVCFRVEFSPRPKLVIESASVFGFPNAESYSGIALDAECLAYDAAPIKSPCLKLSRKRWNADQILGRRSGVADEQSRKPLAW